MEKLRNSQRAKGLTDPDFHPTSMPGVYHFHSFSSLFYQPPFLPFPVCLLSTTQSIQMGKFAQLKKLLVEKEDEPEREDNQASSGEESSDEAEVEETVSRSVLFF